MKHASLFSGIGGFDLAAEWAGWENMFHCEWNEFGQKVLNYYWPNAKSYGDITKTDFSIWRGKIDILTGGFPCQPYSLAGKRLGKEDERHLWPEMLRAIREIQPKWVVGENVFGITNWNGGLVFNEVQTDLETEGYEVQAYVLPACAVNAPHRRDRVWFVAHSYLHRQQRSNSEYEEQSGQGGQYAQRNIEPSCQHGNVADTEGTGAGVNNRGVREGISGINDRETTKTKTITDSDSGRRHERYKCEYDNTRERTICEDESNNGDKVWSNFRTSRSNWTTSNSNSWRLEGTVESRRHGEYVKRESITRITPYTKSTREQGQCEYRQRKIQSNRRNCCPIPTDWEKFPTQPPVCGGDDGLPRELDGITFPKWRTESIKAYGNAIVPQVAYQIFKAINQFNKRNYGLWNRI